MLVSLCAVASYDAIYIYLCILVGRMDVELYGIHSRPLRIGSSAHSWLHLCYVVAVICHIVNMEVRRVETYSIVWVKSPFAFKRHAKIDCFPDTWHD